MIVILIVSLIFIVWFLFKRNRNEIEIRRKVLTNEECNNIINISNKYEYEKFPEPVDSKPAYEIDIYDTEPEIILNPELWEICKNIYDTHFKNEFSRLTYIFLRRYTPGERVELPIHLDENKVTASFLLSDRSEYEGGDLYIFDRHSTEKYRNIISQSEEYKRNFVNTYKNLPIVDYDQGDAVMYSGKHHLHGVLPMTIGMRYTLSFFFE